MRTYRSIMLMWELCAFSIPRALLPTVCILDATRVGSITSCRPDDNITVYDSSRLSRHSTPGQQARRRKALSTTSSSLGALRSLSPEFIASDGGTSTTLFVVFFTCAMVRRGFSTFWWRLNPGSRSSMVPLVLSVTNKMQYL